MTSVTGTIFYSTGYKYQLRTPYHHFTVIRPPEPIVTDLISLGVDGRLDILSGYAWDGPSGPAIHSKDFLRGSLVHDALYQLLRGGYLDAKWREEADKLLRAICIEDKMLHFRAQYVYEAVRACAMSAADSSIEHPIEQAPVDI